MGKRRFNQRGREVKETLIDNTTVNNIKLDLNTESGYGGNDSSNALVLPSKKRETKFKRDKTTVTRILSKKQRKLLEKVVDKKKKKESRSSLLEALQTVQITSEELQQYTSISEQQTKGLKKHFKEQEFGIKRKLLKEVNTDGEQKRISSIAGGNKKRRMLLANYGGEDSDEDSDVEAKADRNYNVVGFEESDDSDEEENMPEEVEAVPVVAVIQTETVPEPAPVKPEVITPATPKVKPPYKPATYIHVERTPEIQAARLKLPILGEEQVIMETINENQIIIIAGETGSGKTTQVPQFLYEAGYAEHKMIGVTEPRRVAAISMSNRVAEEMNLSSDVVSYLIRFEGNTTEKTKIKFMTDGVLLKEIETDFLLSKYSVIILDEAHERSVYTDILVGLLSRIVPTRNKRNIPLKLIIMSATLRVSDFTDNRKLFKTPPPVINVDARQFPVTIHFNKRTSDDYVKEAYNKTVKIHSQLPDGGILIFLTGQQEVNSLVRKLRNAYPMLGKFENSRKDAAPDVVIDDDADEFTIKKALKNARKAKKKLAAQISLPRVDLDSYKLPSDDTEADLYDNDTNSELSEDEDDDDDGIAETKLKIGNQQPLWVLPLYSLLPSDKQALVFKPPPEGTRLCVVATNVAETSLTIPNVKYVVDCGRQKTRLYDKVTGVSAFLVMYTSKAGANQRAGRAGRTAPGHCYRLYSSAVFENDFEAFSLPEIQKKPIDDLMLQMKAMGIDKVFNFPFPSPPDAVQLKTAESRLKQLGALKEEVLKSGAQTESRITPLGRAISAFPVSPRYGKMLALSHQSNLLQYTICIVAALSVQEVLQEHNASDAAEISKNSKWTTRRKSWAGIGNSLLLGDPMVLLRAVGASEYAGSQGKLEEFCQENGLRPKAITEIRKLRKQLTNEINLNLTSLNLFVDPKMEPPTELQSKLLRQIMLSGMGDQVARRVPAEDIKDKQDKIKFKYAYRRHDMEDPFYMHQSSVLKKSLPDWVVYQEIYELQNGDTTKMFMRGITAIEPEWLPQYSSALCNFGAPLDDPPPRYDATRGKIFCHMEGTFGTAAWPLPPSEIEFPLSHHAFRYFAMFLLNGEIFESLQKFVPQLLSTPATMIKSWAKLIPRTDAISNRLMTREVMTRTKLLEVWDKDKNFLLVEYQMWLPESAHSTVSVMWPPKV